MKNSETDELESFFQAAYPSPEGEVCHPVPCRLIVDTFVADAAGGPRVDVQEFDSDGKLATVVNYKGETVPHVFKFAYAKALELIGDGDGGKGVKKMTAAYREKVTWRHESGCAGVLCRCGSLKRVWTKNVLLEGVRASVDHVVKGTKYRFTFETDVTISRTLYSGRCEEIKPGILVEELKPT